MDKQFEDYFHILEVHVLARDEVIKVAYKRLCQLYHPDNGGNPSYFQKIQDAYEVLIDPERKKAYFEKWKEFSLSQKPFDEKIMTHTIYDYIFSPLKEIVNEYMFFIMNGDYEMAYSMISKYDKKRIFKKDFIHWQKLVGQVHQLMDFDCIIESFSNHYQLDNQNKLNNQVVSFKIKVIEMNMLMNQVEEDYFIRNLLFEDGEWKVLINDINIEKAITKYKKIIALNKKNKRKYHKQLSIYSERFSSKSVTISTFIDKCEYEHLRYKRYNRTYSILKIDIKAHNMDAIHQIYNEKILEKNIRNLDVYCEYQPNLYLVLLPETNKEKAAIVENKLREILKNNNMNIKFDLKVTCKEVNEAHKTVKILLEELINIE